jgi:hypothetical protein
MKILMAILLSTAVAGIIFWFVILPAFPQLREIENRFIGKIIYFFVAAPFMFFIALFLTRPK